MAAMSVLVVGMTVAFSESNPATMVR